MRALARVDVGAIERNCTRLASVVAPARLCAVVKADGYGHGAAPAARAAQAGGASWLAVATAGEAEALRAAGLEGPLLVMGALCAAELDVALRAGADVVAWREDFVAAVAARVAVGRHDELVAPAARVAVGRHDELVAAAGERAPAGELAGAAGERGLVGVHVKLDTGMGRLGTRDVAEANRAADAVAAADGLRLAGAMTHFATADEDDAGFLHEQLAAFRPWADAIERRHPGVLVHAANSAGALREPDARFGMVRCGIAVYGMDPFHRDPADHGLEPALELISYVAEVKRVEPGQSAGYGRRFVAERGTWLGTIPIGYGDGVRRGLTNNADVLVGDRRVPLVGTVSMDNVTVDLGDEPVERGAEAVLIGARGAERILAEDVAARLGTINYEVTCGISPRVPREYRE